MTTPSWTAPAGTRCPRCQTALDASTLTDLTPPVREPQPNDLTICCYCGAVLVLTPELGLRPFTLADGRRLSDEQRRTVWRVRQHVIGYLRRN